MISNILAVAFAVVAIVLNSALWFFPAAIVLCAGIAVQQRRVTLSLQSISDLEKRITK